MSKNNHIFLNFEEKLKEIELHADNLQNFSQWLEENIYDLSTFHNLNDLDLCTLASIINRTHSQSLKDWLLSRLTTEDLVRLEYQKKQLFVEETEGERK